MISVKVKITVKKSNEEPAEAEFIHSFATRGDCVQKGLAIRVLKSVLEVMQRFNKGERGKLVISQSLLIDPKQKDNV